MNLPNKLTIARILLTVIIIILLLLPAESLGIKFPKIFVNETIVVNLKYIIVGILFMVASITDFIDGYIARKKNLITEFGKVFDAIADKILVNSVLIILASIGFIAPIIPVIIIIRDIVVDAIKMVAGSDGKVVQAIWMGKVKAACLMVGITLTLFYNLPFELWNLKIADFLLLIASVLAIISAFQYYEAHKEIIFLKAK